MTGLIYVILISLWGVVLVPRWLRHHDESRRRKQTARMERVLNPHTAVAEPEAGEQYQSWREYLRSLARIDAGAWEPVRWVDTVRTSQGRHARRRRTIVLALGALTAITMIGAVVGVVPGFAAVLSTLLLGGYVTVMVRQLRHWAARRPQPVAAPAEHVAGTGDAMRRPAAAATDGVRLVANDGADHSWAPRETTLPIYAGKAKASKIPRRIDLTSRGWTGADMVEQARAQQASPQLQAQFDREFAAVEPDSADELGAYANPEHDGLYRRAANE